MIIQYFQSWWGTLLLYKATIMKSAIICFVILVSSFGLTYGQNLTQVIKGKVLDEATQQPLPFATVVVLNTNPAIGAVTDVNGDFTITNLPLGRYNFQASFLGYIPSVIPEVMVTKGKETLLTFLLRENQNELEGINVKPRVQKESALNPMSMVSVRMFSVEEANRYAGGFDDPARLASAFAGVASSVNNNAIVVRGNAPKFMQWKLEGIEIPNPNHFADLAALGGGGLTALSSNLLANSDFLTGAFPAEYQNTLSGVFDLGMRSGNNSKFEHSFEMGLLGIDAASEGPIGPKGKASYLFNYRYSTLGLMEPILPEDAGGTNYQDLAFKTKFPTNKAGVFTLWGIGLKDRSGQTAETDPSLWTYYQDMETANPQQYMGAIGFNHKWFATPTQSLNTTVALSEKGLQMATQRMDGNAVLKPESDIDNALNYITLKTVHEKKFGNIHLNKTGAMVQQLGYRMYQAQSVNHDGNITTTADQNGHSTLMTAFSESAFNMQPFSVNIGLSAQYFTLNQNYTIEPRAAVAYQFGGKHTLSFGYGLHSRLEPINIYLAETGNGQQANKNLDFTKAHHWVLGYQTKFSDYLSFKVETYYQLLFDVPIVPNTTNSLLNQQDHWFVSNTYTNGGKGKNMGVDITLEHYLQNNFYYLVTASVFQSTYKTDLNQWYSTRYDKGMLLNFLIGKEWAVGKSRQNFIDANVRLGMQGGDRHSPIDNNASTLANDVVYDESRPFSQQLEPAVVSHLTVNYRWNKEKSTHQLSLKIINANGYEEFLGHRMNLKTMQVEEEREALMIPNLSYKIMF
jgi:hypothetical protein